MLLAALILKPLAQTADGDASSLADIDVVVLEAGFDDGPHLVHERSHEFTATLDGNTQGEHGTTAVVGISGTEVLDDELAEGGEDLRRRESSGERVDDAEGRLKKHN